MFSCVLMSWGFNVTVVIEVRRVSIHYFGCFPRLFASLYTQYEHCSALLVRSATGPNFSAIVERARLSGRSVKAIGASAVATYCVMARYFRGTIYPAYEIVVLR